METATRTATTFRPEGKFRAGLILAIVLGLSSIPWAFVPTPDGEDGPPLGVILLSNGLSAVAIIAAVIAWRSDSRAAVRVTAACVILGAITALPAFFVDVSPGIKLAVAISTLASVATIVLLFSPRSATH